MKHPTVENAPQPHHVDVVVKASDLFDEVDFENMETWGFLFKDEDTVSVRADAQAKPQDWRTESTLGPTNFGYFFATRSSLDARIVVLKLRRVLYAIREAASKDDSDVRLIVTCDADREEIRYYILGENWTREFYPTGSTTHGLKDRVEPDEEDDDFEDAFEEALSEVQFE